MASEAGRTSVVEAPPLYADVGLVCTVAGTMAAIALLPEGRPGGAGMVLPGVALSAGLLAAPMMASMRDAKAVLRLEYLLALSVVYWLLLDLLQGDSFYPGLTREDVQFGLLAVGLFGAGGYAACLFGNWRPPRIYAESAATDLEPRLIIRLIGVCFALGIFKYAWAVGFDPLEMLYYAGAPRWSAPWAAARLGGWGSILDHMTYFGYLVPVLTITLAGRIGWSRPATMIAIAMSLLLLLLLAQGGGRRVVGVMAGAPLIAWTLAQRRIDLRRALVIVIAIAAILGFMELMLDLRNRGLSALVQGQSTAFQVERINIDDNFYRLSQTIEIIPDKHDYVYHQHIFYTLVRPIPRALWPGKPVDGGFELARFIGARGLSLSSSVIAEWYMSGGFVLVFLGGVVYGAFARAFSGLWSTTDHAVGRMLYGIAGMALFAGVRSMPDLVLMSYILIAWLPVWWWLVRRSNLRTAPA